MEIVIIGATVYVVGLWISIYVIGLFKRAKKFPGDTEMAAMAAVIWPVSLITFIMCGSLITVVKTVGMLIDKIAER